VNSNQNRLGYIRAFLNNMLIKKNQYPVLAVNVIAVTLYGAYFLSKQNYEFVLYILVIVFFLLLILFTNKHIGLSNWSLWGLTIWGILHMSGGGIVIGDHVLYKQMIFTISETYEILKFDQFVHAFGFGIATLVVYELLKPMMREIRWGRFSLVVVMAARSFE